MACFAGIVSAQSEMPADTITRMNTSGNQVQFGEFLIDMELLKPPQLPEITHEFVFGQTPVAKDFNSPFQLNPKLIITQGSLSYNHTYSVFRPFSLHSGNEQLQMSTYTFNNNTKLTLYGQYNADGYRVPDRSTFPWDKNKFVGGMEMKFNNGFGIRLDVRREANPYFPY